nr:MAG TPA: hypothetical protein [Caudoviricetes sp.]
MALPVNLSKHENLLKVRWTIVARRRRQHSLYTPVDP